ncbi:unnamed protein product, partial [Ectocarpus fasciculatus]
MRHFLVGSFSTPLTLWSWNEQDGTFTYVRTIADDGETAAPTWASQSACGQYVYCTNELAEGASVAAFRLTEDEGGTFNLNFINRAPACGGWPCHLALDADATLVSNFKTGTVAALEVGTDGSLGRALFTVDNNELHSAGEAHAHQVVLGSDGIFYVVDLGTDAVYSYKRTSSWQDSTLIATCKFPQHSGPRHLVLHSNGLHAYVMSEMGNSIFVADIDPESRALTIKDLSMSRYSTLREGESSEGMGGAEVLLSVDERFVYVSNRDIAESSADRSSIAVFAVLDQGKTLQLVQHVYTCGRHPRHMALVFGGDYMVVANKDSHNLVSFRVDSTTGRLSESPI